jgi:CubicO group peptidase (beta-lactamase class C family)
VSPYVDPQGALHDAHKTVGLVVAAVGRGQRGVYGFGATEAGGASVPDRDTVFQIGSISKVLTGLVLAREVVGTGGLKRSDLVESCLPALKGANGTKAVTLGMLVTHYAGLAPMPSNLPNQDPFSPAKDYSMAALKSYLFGLPAPVQAGQAYRYSNTGIGLLGLCLQQHRSASGYHALLQQTLLKDLAISELWGEVAQIPAGARARLAQGYAAQDGKRVAGKPSEMGVLASAGEVTATGAAMLVLLEALSGRTSGPLDAAIVEALKPIKPAQDGDSIAYALEVQPGADGPTYKKSGVTVGGYTAYLAFRRGPPAGVVVLTNVAPFTDVESIALSLLDELGEK